MGLGQGGFSQSRPCDHHSVDLLFHSSGQSKDLLPGMSDDPAWMENEFKSKSFGIKRALAIINECDGS
jgi:hypothetical protein